MGVQPIRAPHSHSYGETRGGQGDKDDLVPENKPTDWAKPNPNGVLPGFGPSGSGAIGESGLG
jgi:hypothetical protein